MSSNEREARWNEKSLKTSCHRLFSSLRSLACLSSSLFRRFSSVCLVRHACASLARALARPNGGSNSCTSRKPLHGILDRLGVMLCCLGGVVGPSWTHLKPSWPNLAPCWGILGQSWNVFGHLAPSSNRLGIILGTFRRQLGPSWRHLGASWERLSLDETSQASQKTLKFRCFFDVSLSFDVFEF